MCESRVVIDRKGNVEEVMSEASRITVAGSSIIVADLLGNSKKLENSRIKEVDFLGHTVTVVENED